MGFIGMHTVRALLDVGEQVVPTSHRSWRIPEFWVDEVGKRVFPEQLDIANPHDVMEVVRKHKATGIVHLAGPPFAGVTPANDYATNTGGLLNLLEAARVGEVRRFVYASSNAVLRRHSQRSLPREMAVPVSSTNAISAYKKAGEILLFHYADRVEMSVAALRPPAVYGPMYYSLMNIMSRFCHAAAKGSRPDYGSGGPPYAEDAMDMAYVKDVAQIFAQAATERPWRTGSITAARARNSAIAG